MMSSITTVVTSVKQYLALCFMYVDEEWLSGCVEYLNEDGERNYTVTEIQHLAKEQWLLNDLKDICPGSLPANLKDQVKTTLNGKYILQVNAAIDIGTPAYQQYLKLQKVNMENIEATSNFEDKIPSHRMIKLHMTDGAQDICGIEYKTMRNLTCDITPGSKVLIKGPVICRRGMLLLTESCLEQLGGEVQEMVSSNSLPQLLSTKLGLPPIENVTPQNVLSLLPSRNVDIPRPHTDIPTFATVNRNESSPTLCRRSSTQTQNTLFNDEDIDIDQISAIEAQLLDSNKRLREQSDSPNPGKKVKVNTVNTEADYPDEDDLIFEEDEEYCRELENNLISKTRINYPVKVDKEPFVYIRQINQLPTIEKMGKIFKIKGQILKLLSKLSVGKDGWSLKCSLTDGTGHIDADFTSNVLSQLVGFTPSEMNVMKKEMATNPSKKEIVIMALEKARETLQELYCIIELTIQDVPKITALHPYGDVHVARLKQRINMSGV